MSQSIRELVDGLDQGRRRALPRLLTIAEDGTSDQLRELVASLHPRTGGARVIGVTGPPGVGKSTLTNTVAAGLRRRDRTVAILAIDPSSPFSGGALLGDRVRMQGHHADPGVFIRSMASRGHLGGLSVATPHALLVLDAAGFDDVIIETVGVGQSEVEIAASADTTIVALTAGMGDGVQAAKAGILEVADLFVLTKTDRGGAGQLESELRGMLDLGHVLASEDEDGDGSGAPPWRPAIVRTVAVRDEGIEDVLDALDAHTTALDASGQKARRRRDRALHTIRELALEQVRRRFARLEDGHDPLLEALAGKVATRQLDPYLASDQLVDALEGGR